jgi:hypothetical protein
VTSRVGAARTSLASLEADLVARDQELQRLRTKLDLAPEAMIEAVFADARSAAEVAKNEAATAEKQLARSKELSKEETKVKARRALFKVLTTDLTAQQFIAFLLEERTKLLLELASERLHTMTSNRYRLELDDKNELEVVDELDADKRRSVDTLSGGETFLASLALVLLPGRGVRHSGPGILRPRDGRDRAHSHRRAADRARFSRPCSTRPGGRPDRSGERRRRDVADRGRRVLMSVSPARVGEPV